MAPPVKSGPRFDNMINVPKVRVIDDEGENLGVMFTREAIEQANEKGLNLVEVSPNADPPVCKYLDVGKFRYEAQKKANLARKTQKTQDIKEVKMRPNIDTHDYDVKMRNVTKFIDNGDKVKITLRFRGREMAHQHLGMDLLKKVQEDVAAVATVEPPIVEWSAAMILERDKPWFDQRLPMLQAAIRKRLGELSRCLGDSEWLDGDFSAADIMMTHVIQRAKTSGLIEEFPNLAAYVTRAEARPAYKRAFAAQLKVFNDANP